MKKFLHEYWVEILISGLAVIGIVLRVNRVDIHATLVDLSNQLFIGARTTANRTSEFMDNFLSRVSLYDLLGFLLLVAAIVFLLYRLRFRYLKGVRWQADNCPRCKGNIHRIHRTPQDRFLAAIVRRPLRRYQCANHACGWSGLLYGKPHESHPDPSGSHTFQSAPK
jgi:hypothetical protein